jgi:hypothetical protein
MKADRRSRIHQMEEEVLARGGTFHVNDGLDDGLHEAFLEHVLAFEDAPDTTLRERLADAGHWPPPTDLWALLARLAEIRVFVESTNHLDDAAVYEWLVKQLDEPTDFPDLPGLMMHIDPLGGWSVEDTALYLRYYATDEDRERWQVDFPGHPIPPKEVPPHDRDRFLPKAYEQHEDSTPSNGPF